VSSPQDRRLRGAVIFSVVCLIAVFLVSRAFDVRLAPDQFEKATAMTVPALGLALGSVYACWLLISALLERRPALRDRQGRWLWGWTLVFTAVLVVLGLMNSVSQTIGQVVLYASGLLVGLIGTVGLLVSALPRWRRRAAGR